jgi:hypothetical protein
MSKVSQQWKALEKLVAQKLGGVRLVRGEDFGVSMLDVECDQWAVDCKWRSSLATVTWYKKLIKDNDKIYGRGKKVPILVIKEKGMRGELVVISLDDFINVVNDERYKIESKETENDKE